MARMRISIIAILTMVLLTLSVTTMVRPAESRPLSLTGASSWYGGPCDSGDNNIPRWMPGDRNRTPGIALRRYDTPRKYFLLTLLRTKRKIVVRHTDYGPHGSTGKLVDINYTAVQGLGFSGCRDDYPTWAKVRITELDSKRRIRYWIKHTKTKIDDRRLRY